MQEFTGLEYVMIDIANQFGLDKLTFKQRIQWVKKHKNVLWAMKEEAENIPKYAAAVLAYTDTLAGKATGHLVGMDAAASGCQCMAALMGCEITAKNTGLIGFKRKDIYTETTKMMSKLLDVELSIDRKLIKQAQMPFYYGSKKMPKTIFGEDTEEYQAFMEANNIIAPGAVDFMNIVQQCWQPYADYHTWVMPDGFVVMIPVIQSKVVKIEVDELDHLSFNHTVNVVEGEEKGISLAANITHSVDAYVMRKVLRKCPFDVLVVHDDYLTHPNNVNYVRTAYIDVMAEIAEIPLLDSILTQITREDVHIEKYIDDLGEKIRGGNYALS